MNSNLAFDTKPAFQHLSVQAKRTDDSNPEVGLIQDDESYSPMTATNRHSGKRQPVILMDSHTLGELKTNTTESNLEMRTDINLAMAQFSPIERRVLARVLVQGMSIEKATQRFKRSSVWWRNWLNNEALPALRRDLGDYNEVRTHDSDRHAGLAYNEVVTR